MAYPPSVPSGARINTTPQVDTHPADHLSIHAALTDIINELGSNPSGAAADVTARFAAQCSSNAIGSGVVLGTGGTTISTISLTVPAAGVALVVAYGTFTTAGVTYPSPSTVYATLTMATGYIVSGGSNLFSLSTNGTSTPYAVLFVVPLSSGANTLTLAGTRTNTDQGGGTPSGGTLTADTGFRLGIVGMF